LNGKLLTAQPPESISTSPSASTLRDGADSLSCRSSLIGNNPVTRLAAPLGILGMLRAGR